MAEISSPAQQAGIISFYDAPEKGPKISVNILLIIVLVFVILIIILDRIAAL